VQVHVAALNRTFVGKVARFADALDQQTRTMDTEIDVENRDGSLVDGMYAETNLVLNQQNNVLTVPIQAVQREGNGASVLLVDINGRVQEREIKLGGEGNDRIEVLSGLSQGDQVMIGDRSQFKTGERVQPKVVPAEDTKLEAGS
jgi:RND family efflux transporter MFP subunit